MTAQDGEPGAWHLHDDIPPEYLRQVTSEQKTLTRNRRTGATVAEWKVKPGRGANHWWDCEIYATAAADMLAVYALREASPPPQKETKPVESDWVKPRKGGWING